MAGSVGSVDFDLVAGPPVPSMRAELQLITRPGVDGVGVKVLGTRGEPVQWQCRSWHNGDSAANTQIAAIEALQGTIVSTEDEWGTAATHVLVELAQVTSKQQVILVGDGERVQVDAVIQLRKVAT